MIGDVNATNLGEEITDAAAKVAVEAEKVADKAGKDFSSIIERLSTEAKNTAERIKCILETLRNTGDVLSKSELDDFFKNTDNEKYQSKIGKKFDEINEKCKPAGFFESPYGIILIVAVVIAVLAAFCLCFRMLC